MTWAVLGVGDPLRRDDGVGQWVAACLAARGWKAYLAGRTPENMIGKVQQERPNGLIVVDAADLELPPGSFRRIPEEGIPTMLVGTHGLPLPFLLSLLRETVGEIVLLGVQPACLEPGEGLTPQVESGAAQLVALLAEGNLHHIPMYSPPPHVDTARPQEEH